MQKKFIIIDKLDTISMRLLEQVQKVQFIILKTRYDPGVGSNPRLFLNWRLRVTFFTYLVENLQIRILVLVTDLLLITVS